MCVCVCVCVLCVCVCVCVCACMRACMHGCIYATGQTRLLGCATQPYVKSAFVLATIRLFDFVFTVAKNISITLEVLKYPYLNDLCGMPPPIFQ